MIPLTDIHIRIRFTEPILGTVPENSTTWETFIRPAHAVAELKAHGTRESAMTQDAIHTTISGHNDEVLAHPSFRDRVEAQRRAKADTKRGEAVETEGDDAPPALPVTSFFRNSQGQPILFNYQVMGHLKESANILKAGLGIKNLRSKIENYCVVTPRQIPFSEPIYGEISRPLRAQTLQGPRVAIATSDVMNRGAELSFTVRVLPNADVTPDVIQEILNWGQYRGMGQWRTGGWGLYELVEFRVNAPVLATAPDKAPRKRAKKAN